MLACLLVACSALPQRPPQSQSEAVPPHEIRSDLVRQLRPVLPAQTNGFHLLSEPEAALGARLELIRKAQHTLDMQYFIWNADATGLQVLREVQAAARRGVRVRILLDHLYSGPIDRHMEQLAAEPNADVRMFNPVAARAGVSAAGRILGSLGEYARIRHRMHNKLLVADNGLAVTGGRNIGDEYLSQSKGNFLDLDLLVGGPIVQEMSRAFDGYWNSEFAYSIKWDWRTGRHAARRDRSIAADVPSGRDPEPRRTPVSDVLQGRTALCPCEARLFVDPVDKAAGHSVEDSSSTLHEQLIQRFLAAQQSIHTVSPYFVRGSAGVERIRKLVDRGVYIQVLTNSLATTDELLAHAVYARYRSALLQSGVSIRELASRPDGVTVAGFRAHKLHAKLSIIDERWLYVGSLNFTKRSEHLNTEMGLILQCPTLARDVLALVQSVPAYELRPSPAGSGVEWVDRKSEPPRVLHSEPGASRLQKLQSAIFEPFVPEEEI